MLIRLKSFQRYVNLVFQELPLGKKKKKELPVVIFIIIFILFLFLCMIFPMLP